MLETGAFLKKKPNALFATQSGPMLVIEGKLHPRIAKASTSAKARDGVCVRGEGVALFAISEGEVLSIRSSVSSGMGSNAAMRCFWTAVRRPRSMFLRLSGRKYAAGAWADDRGLREGAAVMRLQARYCHGEARP